MEKYFKNVKDGYITHVSTDVGEVEITQEEYNAILFISRTYPAAEQGYVYKLKTDLTWEKVEAPQKPEVLDREISDKVALEIILGGRSNETK